jgi:hypothetical protein
MLGTQPDIQDSRLLSYLIASGDMRYIPVNEREVYLRATPDQGLRIQGEIPGCGSDCNINLSQVLFEYAVSCEDCKDHITSAESEKRFGQHLGQVFAAQLKVLGEDRPSAIRLEEAMTIILRSMDVHFSLDDDGNSMRFKVSECPITKAANEPGYSLRLPVVHLGFAALCESVAGELASGWTMVGPAVEENNAAIQDIHFARR